jgi:hypothetical protein
MPSVNFDPHLHILGSSESIAIDGIKSAIPKLVGIALEMTFLSLCILELFVFYAFRDL